MFSNVDWKKINVWKCNIYGRNIHNVMMPKNKTIQRPYSMPGMCTRPFEPRPRWDVAASKALAKTLKSLRSFNVSPRRFPWCMVKHIDNDKKLYGLINLHHGKGFLFVILWVFALYFDNYHWIINGLHHKELQLQCCRHEPLCLSQFASNWN